jgi:DUF971 family protein
MAAAPITWPTEIRIAKARDALTVALDDGRSFTLSAEMLRVMSPSAEVQGHSADQRVTVPKKRNVKIQSVQPVGNYAIKIGFDDGHDTGLYAWSYLALLDEEREARWAAYLAELEAKKLSRG